MEILLDNIRDKTVVGNRVKELFNQTNSELLIVSPYISVIKDFDLEKKLKNLKNVKIICNLYSYNCNPFLIYDLKDKVQIKTRSDIHAKAYITPDKTIIGSANLTPNGIGGGIIEASMLINNKNSQKALHGWFYQMWEDTSHTIDIDSIDDNEWLRLKAKWVEKGGYSPVINGKRRIKKANFVDMFLADKLNNAGISFYHNFGKTEKKDIDAFIKKKNIVLPPDWDYWEEEVIEHKSKINVAKRIETFNKVFKKYKNSYMIHIAYRPSNNQNKKEEVKIFNRSGIFVSKTIPMALEFPYKKNKSIILSFYEKLKESDLPFSIEKPKWKRDLLIDCLNRSLIKNKNEWKGFWESNEGYFGYSNLTTLKSALLKNVITVDQFKE
jgi:hypothetical protein